MPNSVQELNRLLEQSKQQQGQFLAEWELNRAFYRGDQWVFWSKAGKRIDRPVVKDRVMLVDNRIAGIVRNEIAKMTKQKPTFQVAPLTPEQADTAAAQTGEKILEYLWTKLDLRTKLEDVLLWSRVCSAGFWKVCWDSTAGEQYEIAADEEGEPVLHAETGKPLKPDEVRDEEGNLPEGVQAKGQATGEVHVEVCSPFEIFPDPLAKTVETAEWIIHRSVQSPEYIRAHYKVEMKGDTQVSSGSIDSPVSTESGQTYQGVKVHEYWSKPSTNFPKGQKIVWAKEKILESGPNPYGCLPFVMFRSIPVPGRFWPTALTTFCRGPQTELNKIKSQIIENAQRTGNPAMLLSEQSDANPAGVPGEKIKYNDSSPNAKPEYLVAPSMAPYVMEQIDRLEKSLAEISGQHEVSSGLVPPGVKAASAINLLMEADDTRLGPAIYEMEEVLGFAGTMLLKLVAMYWTNERTVLIAGENHAVDAMRFKGAALRENTTAEVQTGSAFPKSKAAKQAAIQDILQMAFQYEGQQPMNPRMIAKVLKDYEAGALSKLFGDMSQDESQINRENQKLAQLQPVKINSYDNHQIHIEGHREYQRTAAYEDLDEVAKKLFEFHVEEHQQFLIATMTPPTPPPEITHESETAPPEPKPAPGGSSG